MIQYKVGSEGSTSEELAVVRGRGGEDASWKVMENAGGRPVHTRNAGVFFLWEIESKAVLGGGREGKAGRDTRPMAT